LIAEFTIINLPSFKADPERHGCRSETVIAVELCQAHGPDRRHVLCRRDQEVGLHHPQLPTCRPKGIMPMHCSVNIAGRQCGASSSACRAPARPPCRPTPAASLIGDDEHGWSENGLFNFEGGCYAKMIRLSEEAEPEITPRQSSGAPCWKTSSWTRHPGAGSGRCDAGRKLPRRLSARPFRMRPDTGRCGQPKNLIMLTCDAFGVMPPIAKLTPAQAMYHFLSGYTAKVAGTEKGVTEPTATFSTCFGAPFMPRHPAEYGALLRELIGNTASIAGWSPPAGPAALMAMATRISHADQGILDPRPAA
jgi:phosphoenolpyruvate carboxykinase (ATP)